MIVWDCTHKYWLPELVDMHLMFPLYLPPAIKHDNGNPPFKKNVGGNHLYNGISSKSCLITGGHW